MTILCRDRAASLMLMTVFITGCGKMTFGYVETLNTDQINGYFYKGKPLPLTGFQRFYKIKNIVNDSDKDLRFDAKCVIPDNCVGANGVDHQVTQYRLTLPDGTLYANPNWSAVVPAQQSITPDVPLIFGCPDPPDKDGFERLRYATEQDTVDLPHLPDDCGDLEVGAIPMYEGLVPPPSVPYQSAVNADSLP